MKGNKEMQTTWCFKSTIAHLKSPFLLAACLILAALGPPAMELARASQGRGSPPVPVSGSFIVPRALFLDATSTLRFHLRIGRGN